MIRDKKQIYKMLKYQTDTFLSSSSKRIFEEFNDSGIENKFISRIKYLTRRLSPGNPHKDISLPLS